MCSISRSVEFVSSHFWHCDKQAGLESVHCRMLGTCLTFCYHLILLLNQILTCRSIVIFLSFCLVFTSTKQMQPPAKTAFVQLAFLISAHQSANQRHVCIMSAAYASTPACLSALSFPVFKLFKQFKCSVHTTLHLNCLSAYHERWYKLS